MAKPKKKPRDEQGYLPGVVPKVVQELHRYARKWLYAKSEATNYVQTAKAHKEDLVLKMKAAKVTELIVGDMKITTQDGVKAVKYDAEKERRKKDAKFTATKRELAEAS